MTDSLRIQSLELAYDSATVIRDLTVEIPQGKITAIVGPNGCGKSTLLRAMARLLAPRHGTVALNGADIRSLPTREVARRLGLLPQSPEAPEGLVVEELVARGRYPHQSWLHRWSTADEDAVNQALVHSGTTQLRDRPVDQLSGGQRQKVWIAMVLAQQTPIMLLDEPTTFLDIAHQLDVLHLLTELNTQENRTIVLVLHDLNQAARYAHHIIALKDGRLVAQGAPSQVVTTTLLADVFAVTATIIPDPVNGTPLCIPISVVNTPEPTVNTPDPDNRDCAANGVFGPTRRAVVRRDGHCE